MSKRTFVTLFGTYELIKLVSARKVNKVKSQKPTFLLRGQCYEKNIQKGNSNFVFRRTSTEIAMLFFGRRSAHKNTHPYPVQRILPHSYLLHNMQITKTEPDRRWRLIRPHLLVISASKQVE